MTSAMVAVAVLVAVLAGTAFWDGRRRAARTFPACLLEELREHKLRCLREAPARVDLELVVLSQPRGGTMRVRAAWRGIERLITVRRPGTAARRS